MNYSIYIFQPCVIIDLRYLNLSVSSTSVFQIQIFLYITIIFSLFISRRFFFISSYHLFWLYCRYYFFFVISTRSRLTKFTKFCLTVILLIVSIVEKILNELPMFCILTQGKLKGNKTIKLRQLGLRGPLSWKDIIFKLDGKVHKA